MNHFKRKLYKRGSSFETTIPAPLLFALDSNKKYFVVFKFDSSANKWNIEFEECKEQPNSKNKNQTKDEVRNEQITKEGLI